jgi:hypothetical protein
MPTNAPTPQQFEEWLEKANWRLAECEAEQRRLKGPGKNARQAKLTRRADRYRGLLTYLAEKSGVSHTDPERTLLDLEHELATLKERMARAALALVHARDSWQKVRVHWGQTADELMQRREKTLGAPGRVPALDFKFAAPEPDAPAESRDAYEILRSLGLC